MSYTNSDHAVTKNKIKITYSYLSTTITGQGKGRFTIKKNKFTRSQIYHWYKLKENGQYKYPVWAICVFVYFFTYIV